MKSRQTGQAFEQKACEYLADMGGQVLLTNYTVPFVGEIDIIARFGDTLIFVEVKARKVSQFGTAIQSVTLAKQQKIIRTAEHFLQENPKFAPLDCRFDVIGFDVCDKQTKIEWLQGAFWLA